MYTNHSITTHISAATSRLGLSRSMLAQSTVTETQDNEHMISESQGTKGPQEHICFLILAQLHTKNPQRTGL